MIISMMLNSLNLNPKTFGLDISDLSLKLINLEKKNGFLNLASYNEVFIEPGVIRKGEIKKEEELIKNIKKAVARAKGKKIKTKYIIASLPEEKAFLQVIKMPHLSKEDLKSAIIYEAENYIPLPIEEVYLDFQIINQSPNQLEVLIAALPRKTVDPYLSCLKRAGLKPIVLEIESLSISRALMRSGIAEDPVLIIDLGATRTSLIFYSGCSLRFNFFVPISSNELTEIIANCLKINSIEAEKKKIEQGLGLKELILPTNNLIEQIKKYIDYYRSHASGKEIKKVLLCGGGANLKGLTEFLSKELGLSVEKGDPWTNVLSENQKKITRLRQEMSLGYTSAIGLALRGIRSQWE